MTDNKLQSLGEIFNEKFFRIPDFQRGYSWGKSQREDFWEDLINLKSESIHYTGLLTIEPITKKSAEKKVSWQDDLWLFDKGFQAYYLIDGQQRLTTSIILINEILGRFDDEGIMLRKKENWVQKFLFQTYNESHKSYKSYIFGYEKDNPSDEYFKTKILGQPSPTANKVPEQTLYTANLKATKCFFNQELSNRNKEELTEIFKKVVSMFKYNLYEIDDDLDVYVTFETMNNRGKPLSNLELLKNRLIYLSTMLDVDDSLKKQLRKGINETWKTIYEYLAKNKDNPMDDDGFLKNHWIMYFKYDRSKSESYAKYILNEKFTTKKALNKELKFSEIEDYINSLSVSVKTWFYLFNPTYLRYYRDETIDYGDETIEWIQKLNRIGMGAFPPLFMASMIKCSEQEFLSLLKSAEKFIFLVFRLSQRKSITQNSHFYRLANKLYFGKDGTTIQSSVKDIDDKIMGESGDGLFKLGMFCDHIKKLHDEGEGFYSWDGLKYFLFEYELSLQDIANRDAESKIQWSDFNKRSMENSIEHIYPQTAKEECWTSTFNSYSEQQIKTILHSLGNLVLLSKSKNSELQNKSFEYKKRHTNSKGNEVGFFSGSYSEIEVASYDNWTPKEILARGIKMLEFLEKRWGVDFEDWGDKEDGIDKKKILRLDFIEND